MPEREIVRPKALAIGPQIQQTLARAWRAGVKIAFGTDAAVYPHGQNAKEFEYMVQAGMPPTVREVQEHLGFRAVQSARQHLEALVAGGLGAVMLENFNDIPFYPDRVPPGDTEHASTQEKNR